MSIYERIMQRSNLGIINKTKTSHFLLSFCLFKYIYLDKLKILPLNSSYFPLLPFPQLLVCKQGQRDEYEEKFLELGDKYKKNFIQN